MSNETPLVAVVTGASRGIGRGVALSLGAAGATVYVVGRTRAGDRPHTPAGVPIPGSIDAVAAEVTAQGGRGIAVACDLARDDAIRALFDQVRADSGHIDILVNNAAVLSESMGVRPFWEAPADLADIIDVGLRCHHVATYYAAPLMVTRQRGLVVNMSFYSDARVHDPAYYASKAGLDKLADVYAEHFRPYGVAAISLWPGYAATERMRRTAEADPETARLRQAFGFESVELSGRVIQALYQDPLLMDLSGKVVLTAEAADHYGLRDLDGFAPMSLRNSYGGPVGRFDAFAARSV